MVEIIFGFILGCCFPTTYKKIPLITVVTVHARRSKYFKWAGRDLPFTEDWAWYYDNAEKRLFGNPAGGITWVSEEYKDTCFKNS